MPAVWDAEAFEKKFEQRTQEIAQERASEEVEKVREVFDRHAEFLGPKLIATLVQRDYESVFKATTEKRNEGRLNDNFSVNPGVRVIVNSAAMSMRNGGTPIEELFKVQEVGEIYVEALKPAEGMPEGFHEFYLPDGTYGMVAENDCQIWGIKAPRGSGEAHRFPMSLNPGFIVRMEGDSGELWQNPGLQPDGSPVAQAA